jgi:hypothetical protein
LIRSVVGTAEPRIGLNSRPMAPTDCPIRDREHGLMQPAFIRVSFEILCVTALTAGSLIWLQGNGRENFFNEPNPPGRHTLDDLLFSWFYTVLFFAPGSILLSIIVWRRAIAHFNVVPHQGILTYTLATGTLLAFFNIPAYFYLSEVIFGGLTLKVSRMVLLLALTGAFCGFLISARFIDRREHINFGLLTFSIAIVVLAVLQLTFIPNIFNE